MLTEENQQGQPDTTPPNEERQRELESVYEQHKDTESPYKGIHIQTLGELKWILEQRQWSDEIVLDEEDQRPNLSGADLRYTNLSRVALWEANLSGANLEFANLSGATLFGVNLSGADLYNANLSDADLSRANLNGAALYNANLSGASLRYANLSGASLGDANLSGTNLISVTFTDTSVVNGIIIDTKTKLGDVKWNGVSLLRVDWSPVLHRQQMLLGDEQAIDELVSEKGAKRIPNRQERRGRIAIVNRAYIGLARELKDQNLTDIASTARLRSKRLNRRAMFLRRTPGSYLNGVGSWLLDIVSGYGEIPQRTFLAYILVVAFFGVLDFVVTNTIGVGATTNHLSWDESLVLSLMSFHGRGFFPGTLQLDDWVARVGAIEAVIGLFIELILIATFSRPFLGD